MFGFFLQRIGAWGCYELMNVARMGESIKERVVEVYKVCGGISNNFLKVNECLNEKSEGYSMMKSLRKSIVESFEKRLPFSEYLSFIYWKWALLTLPNPLEYRLWKSIS